MMKNKIKAYLPAPPAMVMEMWVGIILFACICELIGVWFVKDPAGYTLGIVLGAALSCFCTYHLWATLDKSLGSDDEKRAARMVGGGYIIRYLLLIVLVVVLYFTGVGNPFAAFLGYIGMKPAAYMQPAIHRLADKLKRR